MKEIGQVNSLDIDRVVEDSLDEEGEEMVADDAKKRSIPIRLVNQANTEGQKYIEKMSEFEVVDRKEASGSEVIRTRLVVNEQGNARETKCSCSMHESTNGWTSPTVSIYAPTAGLERVKGVLSHVAAAGRNKDHVVAFVDVRRACFNAELLPKTFVEQPDFCDLGTRTRCCRRLRRCLNGTRQAAKSWQRETVKGMKAAGMVMGKMSKCSFKSPCGKWVGFDSHVTLDM